MLNADHVILTKSIHSIYVGLVKHMNIISLKGWILATVVNFNSQIQGLLFSFDCQPLALYWLRHQIHVVFCMLHFCTSSVSFKASNSMSYFVEGLPALLFERKPFEKGKLGGI